MPNAPRLVIDTMSEVYQELKPYAYAEFWNFGDHEPIPDSVYVLGRQQVVENNIKFLDMAQDPRYRMVFGNSAEGSSTLAAQVKVLGLEQAIMEGRVLLISGGDLETTYPYILHDHFLVRIFDYEENLQCISRTPDIFTRVTKPFKFLFLNGRVRPHRKYLWERLRMQGLLEQSIWTMLDGRMAGSRLLRLSDGRRDIMDTNTPIRSLPSHYEVEKYAQRSMDHVEYPHQYVKTELFNNEWGEIYLRADPYIDTYFSLVTETVFDYPYSFRTEKIAKVLAMGHPWICASNQGFYRDIRNLGFRTFHGIIDEDFDHIQDNQTRLDRVVDVVQDLCHRDLGSFLEACEPICKYNQQHLLELAPRIRAEFPGHFFDFVRRHP